MSLQTRLEALAAAIGADIKDLRSKSVIPLVSALPTVPTNGQEVYLEVDANSAYGGPYLWRCRYSNKWANGTARPGKWDIIGDPQALYKNIEADEQIPAGITVYTDLATVGPTIAVPFAGDYEFEFGCRAYPWAVVQTSFANVSIGGSIVTDTEALRLDHTAAIAQTGSRVRRVGNIAAGAICKLQYRHDNNPSAAPGNYMARWMKITPIRLN